MQKQVVRQRDFSAGQVDASGMRRDDSPLFRAGARQMTNKRLLATGAIAQRPGRRALFVASGRVDEIRVTDSISHYLCFDDARLRIRNAAGTVILTATSQAWSLSTVKDIVWDYYRGQVFLCYPGMQPQVLTYDAATDGWTRADYEPRVTDGGQKRTPFYRFADKGITLLPTSTAAAPTPTGQIGDMTNPSYAFDGSEGTSATKTTATTCWIGQSYAAGRNCTRANVRMESPNTDDGGNIILQLFGKTGTAPASANDGTLLGNVSFAVDNAPGAHTERRVNSIDTATLYDYLWVKLTYDGAAIDFDFLEVDFVSVVGATTGTVNLIFSDDVLEAGHVGTRIRYQGRQITIDTVTDAQNGIGTVNEQLLGGQALFFNDTSAGFAVGDVVEGGSTGAKGQISAVGVSGSSGYVNVSLITENSFRVGETLTSPTYNTTITIVSDISPPETTTWDEEVMNDYRGWPASVSVDQNRLIFADFPGLPRGVGWSASDDPLDMYPDADPDDAIFELVPGATRVYHVIPGDDEFVFTNIGVFYIPISEANPLKPGSVAFRSVTTDPVSAIRPVATPDGVIYVDAGLSRVIAIRSTGQVAKPYVARDATEYHSDLIDAPIALAASSGTSVAERYVYVLNSDGSLAVGRFDLSREWAGWVPWLSVSAASWISAARGKDPLFTSAYVGVSLAEVLDPDAWLDSQMVVHSAPAALAPPVGYGPLWYAATGQVFLMDGQFPLGLRSVDAFGYLIAVEGEDLSSATLVSGIPWTETVEPFVPQAEQGASRKQAMRRRKLGGVMVTAKHGTGFTCCNRVVPPWRASDDRTVAAPVREETLKFKQMGRSYDPTFTIVKDVPGQMTLIEVATEPTV